MLPTTINAPPAMVLCAGFGTRLQPLTHERPKPLVPVGDRPILAHILQALKQAQVGEISLNTHHQADKFSSIFNELGVDVHISHEEEILGTAGGIARNAERLCLSLRKHARALVWNGDILCDPPLQALMNARGALTLLVAPRSDGGGTLGLNALGQVVRLRGERFGEEYSSADFVGISALSAEFIQGLPERGCLIGEGALPWLRAGAPVETLALAGPWRDFGSLRQYLEGNLTWLGERNSWLGEGAEMGAEVQLERCVIGAGAKVKGKGRLERCVVWPGAIAEAPAAQRVFGQTFQVTVE